MSQQPPAPIPSLDRLSDDEQFVVCCWAVEVLANAMLISEDAARDLLIGASDAGRVQLLGNRHYAGVQVDGQWIVVVGRPRISEATREWQTLQAMERQLAE